MDETDRDQWSKINDTLKQLAEHEKQCEKRYGETNSRLSVVESKLNILLWMVGTCVSALTIAGGTLILQKVF